MVLVSIPILIRGTRSLHAARWADVPTTKHNSLFAASSGCFHGSPTVKYRGIFLNDEQPALQNWAMEKFTNGTGAALTGSPFNHFFYTKLYVSHHPFCPDSFCDKMSTSLSFELILRMKGNYLWPGASWHPIAYRAHPNFDCKRVAQWSR